MENYYDNKRLPFSSYVKEVIRGNISLFFYKKILHRKCKEATFIQMLLYAQKALKSKQATFANK